MLSDRNRFSIKLECVVLRFEILDAEVIAFQGSQGCRELFDLGAIRSVTFHWNRPDFKLHGLQKRLALHSRALRNVPRMHGVHHRPQGGQILPSPVPTGIPGQTAAALMRGSNGTLPA